jgi:hypothetical protein
MQQSDFQRFKAVMAGMGKLYEREVDGPMLDAYWLALGNWSLKEFEEAAAHLLQTSAWMPKPSHFTALRKAGRPTSGEAWTKALQACGSAIQCGHVTNNGTSGDPFIDRVVRAIGGYGRLVMCDRDKLGLLQRDFTEHFKSMEDAEDVREAVPQITSTFRPRLGSSGPKSIRDLLPNLIPEDVE